MGEEENLNVLDTYEIIEDLDESNGSTEGTPIQQNNGDFNFADFVANEIGAQEGKILSGSADEPIEYSLSELTPKQQVAILKDYYSRSNQSEPEFSEDEMLVVNNLREGNLEELYNQLAQELGKEPVQQQIPSELTEDQYIQWKVQSELPDLTEDELEVEMESFKNSPNYERRLAAAKNQYQQSVEMYQQQQLQEQQVQQQQQMEELRSQISEIANSTDDIFDFEINDDLKQQALYDLLEPNEETGNPELIDFLGTPEGLTQTALLWRAMPEINEYVNTLHSEIDRLKASQRQEPMNKTVVSTSDVNKNEDILDQFQKVPELKTIN